jgi:hypothetical protein
MKLKSFILLSGEKKGYRWAIPLVVTEKANVRNACFFDFINKNIYREKYREKTRMRDRDNKWVRNFIPSSIWWKTEIHHDWKDGGRMYLLTKGEHILWHRREK